MRLVPRKPRQSPAQRVDQWPGPTTGQADVDVARHLARNLSAALAGRSTRQAATLTGVDATTIQDILNGQVWPDSRTIALLEAGLGADVWPAGIARQSSAQQSAGQ